MIYTSHFGSRKWQIYDAVSIARYTPKWFTGKTASKLYPPGDILDDYKNHRISEEEYAIRYRKDVLSKLNPNKVYTILDDKVLLCYEKSGEFCHRYLVADWLREYGYEVREL